MAFVDSYMACFAGGSALSVGVATIGAIPNYVDNQYAYAWSLITLVGMATSGAICLPGAAAYEYLYIE